MYDIYYFHKLRNHAIAPILASLSSIRTLDEFHGDKEIYHRENIGDIEIKYIGVKLNQSGRFILAVVDGADIQLGANGLIIGLEVTETHDYAKTLVENDDRRSSWNKQILAFINSLKQKAQHPKYPVAAAAAASAPKSRPILSYRDDILVLDSTQEWVAEQSIDKGMIVFGGAGTGKSMLLEHLVQQFLTSQSGNIGHFAPNDKLCGDMHLALNVALPDGGGKRVHSFTWEKFLNYVIGLGLSAPLPEGITCVDLAYFNAWLMDANRHDTKDKRKKVRGILSKYDSTLLWRDYLFTICQPSPLNPGMPYLSEADYLALGRMRAHIPHEDRATVYQSIFKRFLDVVKADKTVYEPRLLAYELAQNLLTARPAEQHLFDGIVIDEQTLFHPYELRCMMLMHKNIRTGWFFMCGDISQSVAMLNPHFADDLLHILSSEGVPRSQLLITSLQSNYRNAEIISRFVSLIHEIEKELFGSFDNLTHTSVVSHGHVLSGSVSTTQYVDELKCRVAHDPDAVIVVPNEEHKKQVLNQQQWPPGQVFTLRAIQGSQAKTVILDGFSMYFAATLRQLYAHRTSFPAWNAKRPYSREKAPSESMDLLETLQALYTAISRAISHLIITESNGTIHPVWSCLIEKIEMKQQVAPPVEKPTASKADWFKRIHELIESKNFEQVDELLLRDDLWGPEWLSKMASLTRDRKITFLENEIHPSSGAAPETKALVNQSTTSQSKSAACGEDGPKKRSIGFFQSSDKKNDVKALENQLDKNMISIIKILISAPNEGQFTALSQKDYAGGGSYLQYILSKKVSDAELGLSNSHETKSVMDRLLDAGQRGFTAITALSSYATKMGSPEEKEHEKGTRFIKNLGLSIRSPRLWISMLFYDAVSKNKLNLLGHLLALGYHPDWVNKELPDVLPLLHCAIKHKFTNALKMLVQQGADVEYRAKVHFEEFAELITPLQCAVALKNKDAIDILMTAEVKPRIDPEGVSVMHLATNSDHIDLVQTLHKHGASLNEVDKHHWRPIQYAIINKNLQMLRYFLENGVDIETRTSIKHTGERKTLLHFAISENNMPAAIMLINSGAVLSARCGNSGITPLMIAVVKRNLVLIDFILSKLLEDKNWTPQERHSLSASLMGDTPLSLAISDHRDKSEEDCRIVESLIKAGFDDEIKTPKTMLDGQYVSVREMAKHRCHHCYEFMKNNVHNQNPADEPEAESGHRLALT